MDLTEREISTTLLHADTFRFGDREIHILFLLPRALWRPLRVSWWKGKEVSLIGGDDHGNYLLRHCDGTVRLWDHSRGVDEIVAPSVRAFISGLGPASQ